MHILDELKLVASLPDECLFSRGPLHILYTTTLSYNNTSILLNPKKIIDLSTDINIVTSMYHKSSFFNQKIKFILPYFCRKQLPTQNIEIYEKDVTDILFPTLSPPNTILSVLNLPVAPNIIHLCQHILPSDNIGLLEKVFYTLLQHIPTIHVYDIYPSTKYVATMMDEIVDMFHVNVVEDSNHYTINQNETSLQKAQQYNGYLKTKYPSYFLHVFTNEYDTTMAEAFRRLEAVS